MNTSLTERINRLQDHLSNQYVDFDRENTTDRLQSLYSDFSKLKILNNYAYDANINYWRAVILDCNLHGYLNTKDYNCFIDTEELADLFYRPKKGKPLSLDLVVKSMLEKTHDLITQKEFEKRYPITVSNPFSQSVSWFQWMYRTPYHWIIPETPPHLYIVLPTVQEYAKIIVQCHYNKPLCSSLDNLFTFLEFREEYGTIPCHQETIVQLSDMDLWLILRYLHTHYGIAVAETVKTFGTQSTVIKFPDRTEATRLTAKISENDKSIINLRTACSALHKQVDELQAKMEEFMESSRQHYKKKQHPQALYMLKKKKKLDDILERRLKTLETMETILLKIETSQNDLQVAQAFNLGADTLRSLLNTEELKAESVNETMERIQDSLQDQNEVEQAMLDGNNEISNQTLGISQDELENELASIVEENNRRHSPAVRLTQPIDTESELLRLQSVLSSLNHPGSKNHNSSSSNKSTKDNNKAKAIELAS